MRVFSEPAFENVCAYASMFLIAWCLLKDEIQGIEILFEKKKSSSYQVRQENLAFFGYVHSYARSW